MDRIDNTMPAAMTSCIRRLVLPLLIGLLVVGCSSTPVRETPKPPVTAMTAKQAADARVKAWRQLIATNQKTPEARKLEIVNGFFNQFEFVDDIIHWGVEDYWATPLETVKTNGGDCEDFVIGKYFTLRYLQVPDERLRMTFVKALSINKAHMVLTYYPTPGAEPLVLDNLDKEIKRSSQRKDLVPVYSFNSEGLWLAHDKGLGSYVRESSSISLWQTVLEKMKIEETAFGR